VTVFGNRVLERAECDGVWEQGAGERRGQSVTVLWNRVLERGDAILYYRNFSLYRDMS